MGAVAAAQHERGVAKNLSLLRSNHEGAGTNATRAAKRRRIAIEHAHRKTRAAVPGHVCLKALVKKPGCTTMVTNRQVTVRTRKSDFEADEIESVTLLMVLVRLIDLIRKSSRVMK